MQDTLARKLRVLRAERGLTLREAEHQTGVDKDTLSKLERGLRQPFDVTLSKLAKGYGVPVEELLEEPALAGKAEASAEGAFGERKLASESSGSEAGRPSGDEQASIVERVWARINLLTSTAAQWERLVGEGHHKLEAPNLETLKTIDAVTVNVVINHTYDAASMERAATDEQRVLLDKAKRRMFGAYQKFWFKAEKHLSDTQPHSVTDLQAVRERRSQLDRVLASETAGSQAG